MANVKFRLRRDTAANWTSANPVLALAEPGLETDTRKVKYGDGVTAWTGLDYAAAGSVAWTGITGTPAFAGVGTWTRTSGNPSLKGAADFVLDGDAGSGTLFLNAYCTGDVSIAVGGGTVVVSGKALRMPNKAADPASPSAGDLYFNSNTGKFRGYTGAGWVDLH